MVAPVTAGQLAVRDPSARVTVTDEGVAGGIVGVYGAAGGEFRQPLSPALLRARTPTRYVLLFVTLSMVMLFDG